MNSIFFIAGPCAIESKSILDECASELKSISVKLGVEIIFKSSYKKANRTSIQSFTGIGDLQALEYLNEIGKKYSLKTLTDIHSAQEAKIASEYVDILQIPAFLSRQTDILISAGETNKPVNIKKGQFLAPEDMKKAAEKVASTGNNKIWLTERGTFFGYHNLVVDFRSLVIMKEFGYPVIFDATHSVQMPSIGEQSGGQPKFIPHLAKSAVAIGVDGIFFETHPDPQKAKSDASTQLPLKEAHRFIENLFKLHNWQKQLEL